VKSALPAKAAPDSSTEDKTDSVRDCLKMDIGYSLRLRDGAATGQFAKAGHFFYEVSLKGEQLDKSHFDYKHYFSLKIGLLRPIFKEKVGV
jgi:hypothetical protein